MIDKITGILMIVRLIAVILFIVYVIVYAAPRLLS